MIKRNIKAALEKGLSRSPIVLLTGARQTGKTTLMKEIAKEKNYSYITFDDIRFLSAAKNDPIGFVEGLSKPVILDEVQRVPEIFTVIKQNVDENRKPGMYALTGSANPLLIPRLGDAFVGRMEIFSLFPFSQGELQGKEDRFIDALFNNQIPQKIKSISKEDLYQRINTGGYPLVQEKDYQAQESWFNSYITTLLQRDVVELAQITGLSDLPRLLYLLAPRAGNLLNVAELSRSSGISNTTLHRYLVLLETLFIITFQRPWSSNLSKRFIKAPKTYLVDSGLLSFLLGSRLETTLLHSKIAGIMYENFVVSELYKQATWNATRVKMYHMRTATGIEVDIALEDAQGRLVCIEVKSSDTVTAQDFKGLKYIEELTGEKFLQGVVLYSGSSYIPFGSKLCALPIQALWES